MTQVHDIYDRIAKRCISLSSRCTINLINGLFNTEYPTDSKVTYNWTENTDDELRRTLADTIVTINDRYSYHIEFQMTKDGDIILRMLEYGFHHALNTMSSIDTIQFPEPHIIYLYDRESFPDEYILTIQFGSQGSFDYRVPVFRYLGTPIEELDKRKLIVLLPFQLLKLRRAIEKERSKENMQALKNLIRHDILNSLNRNVDAGNITSIEAAKLSRMILHLYHHIYDKYDELESEGVNQMAEEALIFDVDILDAKIRKLEKSTEILENKNKILQDANQSLQDTNQSLQSTNQSLQDTNQSLIRVLADTLSPEEISARTGIKLTDVLDALQSEEEK